MTPKPLLSQQAPIHLDSSDPVFVVQSVAPAIYASAVCPRRDAMIDHDLTHRAVACPGWRWMDGMAFLSRYWDGAPSNVLRHCRVAIPRATPSGAGVALLPPPDALPDFSDPATLGCLLALVREARGDLAIHVRMSEDGTVEVYSGERYLCHQHGEAEALVATLEAAPRRTP